MSAADREIAVGVAGVGHLGRHHARIYNEMPETRLVGVVDTGFAVHIFRASGTGRYFYTIGRDGKRVALATMLADWEWHIDDTHADQGQAKARQGFCAYLHGETLVCPGPQLEINLE